MSGGEVSTVARRGAPHPRRSGTPRWYRRPAVMDSTLLVVLAGATLLYSLADRPGDMRTTALGLVMLAALAFRRSRPVASFVAVLGLAGVQWLLGIPVHVYDVAVPLACYSAVVHARQRWWGWLAAATLWGALVVSAAGSPATHPVGAALTGAALTGTVVAYGSSVRNRRAYLAELEERAAAAERERDQRTRLAAVEERARIARELHDVVAHSLSVVVVQADGARYAMRTAPETAGAALETIAATGRQALEETRRLLGVLRTGEPTATDDAVAGTREGALDGAGGGATESAPQPGVDDLPALVARMRAAGCSVALTDARPRAAPVPSGLGLSAYRIVQEALTNTLRHAGEGAAAIVRVAGGETTLYLTVEDDGRGPGGGTGRDRGHGDETGGNGHEGGRNGDERDGRDETGGGHGLVGMRERAALYGGHVEAGSRPGGGFRVHAVLPLTDDPEPPFEGRERR